MKRNKWMAVLLVLCLVLTACGQDPTNDPQEQYITKQASPDATMIHLSDQGITVDGAPISDDASAAVFAANDRHCHGLYGRTSARRHGRHDTPGGRYARG